MGKNRALLLLAGLSLGLAPAPLPRPDTTEADARKMQGTWALIREKQPGEWTMVIAGDRVTYFHRGELRPEGTHRIRLDARKGPKAIDFDYGRDQVFKGIYSLQGDTLILCTTAVTGLDRPKDLMRKRPLE